MTNGTLRWCWLAALACSAGCTAHMASVVAAQPMPAWLTPLILLVSVTVSLVSLRLTLLASRAETFRNLRVAFNKLRDELPDRFWLETTMPTDPRQFIAMVKYWQFAFDEWFITQRLNPKVFGKLWHGYYDEVIKVSCRSPTMIAALFQAAVGASGEADRAFLELVLREPYTSPEVLRQAKAMAQAAGIPIHPAACTCRSDPALRSGRENAFDRLPLDDRRQRADGPCRRRRRGPRARPANTPIARGRGRPGRSAGS